MKNIELCSDGVYRWNYEFDMIRNPIILLTVWKIFLYVLLGMWLVFGAITIPNRDGVLDAFKCQALELALPAAILLVLSVVGYIILACIYGWKYCVLFEMDNEGIRHIQMEKQVKKAEVLGFITLMAGAAANNPGAMGAGLLSSTKSVSESRFSSVKRVKAIKSFHTIKLDGPLNHNQIYAEDEDLDFVLDYINQRVGKQ